MSKTFIELNSVLDLINDIKIEKLIVIIEVFFYWIKDLVSSGF